MRETGYSLYLSHHPSVRWAEYCRYDSGQAGTGTTLGITIDLSDGREMCFGVTLTATEDGFAVAAEVTIDEDLPDQAAGNQRYLLDLPETRIAELPDCITVLEDYVRQLAASASRLLEECRPATN